MSYLDVDDPRAFEGLEVKEKPSEHWTPCHVCKQHGGWHLRINAYGEGQHFNAHCSQCNGWGWVKKGSLDDTCERHEFASERIGHCLHRDTCKHCGRTREVDTSDQDGTVPICVKYRPVEN